MNNRKFKISLLSSLIIVSFYSHGEDYFDPTMLDSLLGTDINNIDLTQFSKENSIPQGEYAIQVIVNTNNLGDKMLKFIPNEKGDIVPELTPKMLTDWGVNVPAIPKLKDLPPDTPITNLSEYISDATMTPDVANLKIKFTIPQIAMLIKADGYIDPSLWDNGITALFFNYFISGDRQWNKADNTDKQTNDHAFANIQGGLNLGVWRLRSNFSYNYSDGDSGHSSSNRFSNTYIMRTFSAIRSTLAIGELSSSNDIFDSIPFKGIQLSSNDQMLPSSLRGFAPEVRGIAQSNARITIRQNGYVVYQTYVAPGPFNIKDISPSGNAGNLEVTITEEDGTEKMFTVAFSSLPIMQRPGGYKYEAIVGRYDGGITTKNKNSDFISASGSYGLPINTTLYSGLLVAQDYLSIVGGLGISLGSFGAISTDITHSTARLNNDLGTQQGQSYRVRYSKSMTSTGTSVDLTALRYSTRSYFSFSDFNNYNYDLKDGLAPWLNQRQRSSFTTSISQSLGQYGSIYVNGSVSDYWAIDRKVKQFSMGYNNSYKFINYSVDYSIDRIKDKQSWPENRQISVNVNIPFSAFSNHELAQNMSSSYSVTRDNNNRMSHNLGLSGSALDNKLTYGISQNLANKGQGNNGNIYSNYSGSKGTASLGYNYSRDHQTVNGSFGGGAMLHSGGVLLGPNMGNTTAVVEAKGAEGMAIEGNDSVINSQGYALHPYVSPYHTNYINMNINTLPENVMLNETSKMVYPTAGAVVKVKFDTRVGYQAIITLKRADGSVIPFGANATLLEENPESKNTGIVSDNNQLFMSGLPNSGNILVNWGTDSQLQCTAMFSNLDQLPVSVEKPIRSFDAICQ